MINYISHCERKDFIYFKKIFKQILVKRVDTKPYQSSLN